MEDPRTTRIRPAVAGLRRGRPRIDANFLNLSGALRTAFRVIRVTRGKHTPLACSSRQLAANSLCHLRVFTYKSFGQRPVLPRTLCPLRRMAKTHDVAIHHSLLTDHLGIKALVVE
jgi:hypothetical protein